MTSRFASETMEAPGAGSSIAPPPGLEGEGRGNGAVYKNGQPNGAAASTWYNNRYHILAPYPASSRQYEQAAWLYHQQSSLRDSQHEQQDSGSSYDALPAGTKGKQPAGVAATATSYNQINVGENDYDLRLRVRAGAKQWLQEQASTTTTTSEMLEVGASKSDRSHSYSKQSDNSWPISAAPGAQGQRYNNFYNTQADYNNYTDTAGNAGKNVLGSVANSITGRGSSTDKDYNALGSSDDSLNKRNVSPASAAEKNLPGKISPSVDQLVNLYLATSACSPPNIEDNAKNVSSSLMNFQDRFQAQLQRLGDQLENQRDAATLVPDKTTCAQQRAAASTKCPHSPTRSPSGSGTTSRQETPQEAFLQFRQAAKEVFYPSLLTKAPPAQREHHSWGGNPDSDDEGEAVDSTLQSYIAYNDEGEAVGTTTKKEKQFICLESAIPVSDSSPAKVKEVDVEKKPTIVVASKLRAPDIIRVMRPTAHTIPAAEAYNPKSPLRRGAVVAAGAGGNVNGTAAPVKRSKVCRFWLRGNCLKGKYCDWAHRHKDSPPALNANEPLCTYWKHGICNIGEKCQWKHTEPGVVKDPFEEEDQDKDVLTCQPVPQITSTATVEILPMQPIERKMPTATAGASSLIKCHADATAENKATGNLLEQATRHNDEVETRHQNEAVDVECQRLAAENLELKRQLCKSASVIGCKGLLVLLLVAFYIGYHSVQERGAAMNADTSSSMLSKNGTRNPFCSTTMPRTRCSDEK
ncbi:unnamed protein product [Amoebophrya sp. A25]|nr:unnamed protein product [Amoebophrya sp. A25]|eukprot:GSA25T00027013001.1